MSDMRDLHPLKARPASWAIDPRRSVLAFTGRRLGAPWVEGMFTKLSGRIALESEEPSGGECELVIAVRRLVAGTPELNTHLRVFDLLEADKHPTLPITIEIGERLPDGRHRAQGTVQVAGAPITTGFELELELSGPSEGTPTAAGGLTLNAKTTLGLQGGPGSGGRASECELELALHVVAPRESLSAAGESYQGETVDHSQAAKAPHRRSSARRLTRS